jgi:hypothetical protein
MKICVGVGVLLGLLHKSFKHIKGIELVAIQEASPERKNLTVTSLGFILFFLGEGELDAETIKFQLVNISFKNPEVLSCFLWLMLIWFFWRYFLKFRGTFEEESRLELKKHSCNFLTRNYVKFKKKLKYKKPHGFSEVYLQELNTIHLTIHQIIESRMSEVGNITLPRTSKIILLKVSFLPMQLFKFYTLFLMLVKEPTITNIYLPYLLFISAVLLGLERIYT